MFGVRQSNYLHPKKQIYGANRKGIVVISEIGSAVRGDTKRNCIINCEKRFSHRSADSATKMYNSDFITESPNRA